MRAKRPDETDQEYLDDVGASYMPLEWIAAALAILFYFILYG